MKKEKVFLFFEFKSVKINQDIDTTTIVTIINTEAANKQNEQVQTKENKFFFNYFI